MDTPTKAPGDGVTKSHYPSEQTKTMLECFRCGVCCIKYQAPLNSGEAQRIADYFEVPLEVFLDRFTDHRWLFGSDSLLCHLNGACAFLNGEQDGKLNNCRIHPVRPKACRDWEAGLDRKECRDGLAKCWQLSVNSSGQLEGSKEKLREFQSFCKSLANAEITESKS